MHRHDGLDRELAIAAKMNMTILSPTSRATRNQLTIFVATPLSHKRTIADRTSGVMKVSATTPRCAGPKRSKEAAMVIPPLAAVAAPR